MFVSKWFEGLESWRKCTRGNSTRADMHNFTAEAAAKLGGDEKLEGRDNQAGEGVFSKVRFMNY